MHGQFELHGRCRSGVLLSPCFGALLVADLILGMEDLELHYRCRGRSNFRKIRIVTISVRKGSLTRGGFDAKGSIEHCLWFWRPLHWGSIEPFRGPNRLGKKGNRRKKQGIPRKGKFFSCGKGPPFHGSRSSREIKIQNESCQMGGREVTGR